MRIVPPETYIEDTGTAKGRGVFASRAFRKGETVEVCPVVPFNPLPGASAKLPGELERILFSWGDLTNGPKFLRAVALGYGSMYNHADPANLLYRADARALELHFVAVCDIAAQEELTINYNSAGGAAETAKDYWFTRTGVKQL